MTDAGIKISAKGDYSNNEAIDKVLTYIFQYPTEQAPNRKPKPIHFYGLPYIGYPPKIEDVIVQFKMIRQRQNSAIQRKLWHFQITFPFVFPSKYDSYFYFADAVASIFCREYPVCYAYHTENRHTNDFHSHFHFVVSTSSYISGYPPLDAKKFQAYLTQIPPITQAYGIHLYHLQSLEELQLLDLKMIF